MFEKIYFDMDGVLADFERGVKEICGLEPISQNGPKNEAAEDEMWARIRDAEHFYDQLELLPGAKEMFDLVYEKYGDRCEILTAIPRERRGIIHAADDKRNWMRRLLSKDVKVNIVYRKDKAGFCTGHKSILIDDLNKNIREWKEIGGTGIVHTDAKDTIRQLKELMAL